MSQAVQNGLAIVKDAVRFQIPVVRGRVAVIRMNSAQVVLILFVPMLVVEQTLPQERNAAASKVMPIRYKEANYLSKDDI